MKPVELFHIGPPKTATTWFYRCFREHPEIATSSKDTIHYFDIHYAHGRDWYADQFNIDNDNQKLFDPTTTYLPSSRAPKRIHAENPAAKFFFVLRHPIDRAFSHYWHERKFDIIQFDFEQTLEVYELFEAWMGMGLIADRLEAYFNLFPKDNFQFIRYEEIKRNPKGVYQNLARHYGVDPEFTPSLLDKKVNVAGPKMNIPQRAVNKLGRVLNIEDNPVINSLSGKAQYTKGVDTELYNRLLVYCIPEIERMEKLLSIDLSDWKIEKQHEKKVAT